MSVETLVNPAREPSGTPMEAAADRALAKADQQVILYSRRARWIPEDGVWLVASSREGEPPATVRRKKDAAEAAAKTESGTVERTGAKRGYWWFVLDCNCPAALSGYAVCWHKAAVFRWWQQHRRVDGKAYADLPDHQPAAAHAAGQVDPDGVEKVKDRLQERESQPPPNGEASRGKDATTGPVYYDHDVTRDEWVRVNRDVPPCEWCDGAPFCEVECPCPECVEARSPVGGTVLWEEQEPRW